MRTRYRVKCGRRAPEQQPVEIWARAVVADPAAYGATERDAKIVRKLLAQLGGAR